MLGMCAPNIYLLVFMVVRGLLFLSMHSVPSELRWHVHSCLEISRAQCFGSSESSGWPWGSDPAFYVIWIRFRQSSRYLAYRPEEEGRIYRLMDYGSTGPLEKALFIFLSTLLSRLFFSSRKGASGLVFLHCVWCLCQRNICVVPSANLARQNCH